MEKESSYKLSHDEKRTGGICRRMFILGCRFARRCCFLPLGSHDNRTLGAKSIDQGRFCTRRPSQAPVVPVKGPLFLAWRPGGMESSRLSLFSAK